MSALPFTSIRATIDTLAVHILDAQVSIRHENRTDIAVVANNPSHWQITDGVIRQTHALVATETPTETATETPTAVSSTSVSSARDEKGRGDGFAFIGQKLGVAPGVHVMSIVKGEFMLNWQAVPHADTLVDSSAEAGDFDRLEIVVPNACEARLLMSNMGGRDVDIDGWWGESFNLFDSGAGEVKVGALHGLEDVIIESSNSGFVRIGAVSANAFIASLSGSAILTLDWLQADVVFVRQTGTGRAIINSGGARSGLVTCGEEAMAVLRGDFH